MFGCVIHLEHVVIVVGDLVIVDCHACDQFCDFELHDWVLVDFAWQITYGGDACVRVLLFEQLVLCGVAQQMIDFGCVISCNGIEVVLGCWSC